MFDDDLISSAQNTHANYQPTAADVFEDSFNAAFADSITGELASRFGEFFKTDEEKTITGADLNIKLGLEGDDVYGDDETFSQDRADDLIRWKKFEEANEINSQAVGMTTAGFLGGLAGGIVSDPITMVAGTAIGQFGATAIKAVRAGTSMAKAATLIRSTKGLVPAIGHELAENIVGTAIVDVPAMAILKESRKSEFEIRDAATMVIGNAILGTALSTTIKGIAGDFSTTNQNVGKAVRQVESQYGSNAQVALNLRETHAEKANILDSNTDSTFVDDMMNETFYKDRSHQTKHVHTIATAEDVKNRTFFISRTAGQEGFASASKEGIGSITLIDNKNIAENLVVTPEGGNGSLIGVKVPEGTNIIDANNLTDLSPFKQDVDLSKANTIEDVIDAYAKSGIDSPKERVQIELRDSGVQMYFKQQTLGSDSLSNALTVLDDAVFSFKKNEAAINKQQFADGITVTSKGLDIVEDSRLLPLSEFPQSRESVVRNIDTLIKDEDARMSDPYRNGQYVDMQEKALEVPEFEKQLDDNIESIKTEEFSAEALNITKEKMVSVSSECRI